MKNELPEYWDSYSHPEQPWCLRIPISPTKQFRIWFSNGSCSNLNVDYLSRILLDVTAKLKGTEPIFSNYVIAVYLHDTAEYLSGQPSTLTKLYPIETK